MNLSQQIGNTPLIKIDGDQVPPAAIYAKFEAMNPSGSIKDRIAKHMIESAEASGILQKEQIILEATSGNTGISLAMIGALKGYQVTLLMPANKSIERIKLMRFLGAEVILTTPDIPDSNIRQAIDLKEAHPKKYFYVNQNDNDANWLAHYQYTAHEILQQTDGEITHVIACMGTGGTITGIGKRLKEYNSAIRVIGVHPFEAAHLIEGTKNMHEGYRPKVFNTDYLDSMVTVSSHDAISTTQQLAKTQGILVGISSGAALWAAKQVITREKNARIVVIFPDGNLRYLSTQLYQRVNEEMAENRSLQCC